MSSLQPQWGEVMRGSSAEKVALLRAFGSLERDPAIRNPDSLAAKLVSDSGKYRFGLRMGTVRPLRACGRWAFAPIGPRVYWTETARVKHFDRILLKEVAAGVPQVIVLGAGLDSRGYRFRQQLDGVRFFEVDHPAMAARKHQRLEAIFGSLPEHVTYLSHDLDSGNLSETLSLGGFDADEPALVLWIGVTMYLQEEVVAEVLRWAGTLATGSSLGFDYFDQSFYDDKRVLGANRRARLLMGLSGEQLIYGIEREAVPGLLDAYSLAVRSHLGAEEMAVRYLQRSSGRRAGRVLSYAGYVHAGVAG
jgi:methyltransferase (TIGR00027 family)